MKTRPPIPIDAKRFQKHYGFHPAKRIIRWEWSDTFGRWGALVEWPDGTRVFTWPDLCSFDYSSLYGPAVIELLKAL